MPTMTPAKKSSLIAAHGYDAETQTLRIKFNDGAEYDFVGIPSEINASFVEAESPGKFFHAKIRNNKDFTSKRVEAEKPEEAQS